MQNTTKPSLDSRLLSTRQLADFLGVPVGTVYQWRYRGGGPPGYRIGRHTRYLPSEVTAWLEGRKSGAAA